MPNDIRIQLTTSSTFALKAIRRGLYEDDESKLAKELVEVALGRSQAITVLAVSGTTYMGCGLCMLDGELLIYVLPRYRGRRIGSKIIKRFSDYREGNRAGFFAVLDEKSGGLEKFWAHNQIQIK